MKKFLYTAITLLIVILQNCFSQEYEIQQIKEKLPMMMEMIQ